MAVTQQMTLNKQQLADLLHDIFAASKERLATFDSSFDPAGQELIRTLKRAVYDVYIQHDYATLFATLETLLSALERIEISYLERKKNTLETHVDSYMKEALDAVQTNDTTPYMEPINVDHELGTSLTDDHNGALGTSLPYNAWRQKIERIYAVQEKHESLHGRESFVEVVMIWSSMGVMGMYLFGFIVIGPVLWYSVALIGAIGLLSMLWRFVKYA